MPDSVCVARVRSAGFSLSTDLLCVFLFFLMIRRPPRSTPLYSSAASDVYKRQGGGCSGFQYGFKFDDSPEGDDDTVNFDGFTILLDSLSYPYLYGSTLDYVEDLSGSRFLVTNPNAKTTCGCGESFTI